MSDAVRSGYEWEREFAALVGGEVVPGSGSGKFRKLDVRASVNGRSVLFSCKSTAHRTSTLSPELLAEATNHVRGPGGHGGGMLPAIALRFGDRRVVVMEEDEFADLFSSVGVEMVTPGKARARFEASKSPPLARTDV